MNNQPRWQQRVWLLRKRRNGRNYEEVLLHYNTARSVFVKIKIYTCKWLVDAVTWKSSLAKSASTLDWINTANTANTMASRKFRYNKRWPSPILQGRMYVWRNSERHGIGNRDGIAAESLTADKETQRMVRTMGNCHWFRCMYYSKERLRRMEKFWTALQNWKPLIITMPLPVEISCQKPRPRRFVLLNKATRQGRRRYCPRGEWHVRLSLHSSRFGSLKFRSRSLRSKWSLSAAKKKKNVSK